MLFNLVSCVVTPYVILYVVLSIYVRVSIVCQRCGLYFLVHAI